MSGPLSIRTQVRDAVVAALSTIAQSPTVRVPGGQVVTNFASEKELTKFPSYCVVVTDEAIDLKTQQAADVALTVLVVVYVRSEGDVRAMLDGAIEDVWDALRAGQLAKPVVSQLTIDTIETDEGTTIVKPFAQAVMRWTAQVRRAVSW